MPIYEYECTKCGELTEALQHFSDPPLSECKKCHGKLRKVISHSTFHLKGTGWYATDYASKSSSGKHTKTSSKESSTKSSAEKPKKKDSSSND